VYELKGFVAIPAIFLLIFLINAARILVILHYCLLKVLIPPIYCPQWPVKIKSQNQVKMTMRGDLPNL
jgi:hypothetical protein